jgi:anti-sigma-K factor RskA
LTVKAGDRVMALWRHCCSFAIVAFAALAPGVAFSQQRGDPIGPLTRVATFDRAQQVNVGKTKAARSHATSVRKEAAIPSTSE